MKNPTIKQKKNTLFKFQNTSEFFHLIWKEWKCVYYTNFSSCYSRQPLPTTNARVLTLIYKRDGGNYIETSFSLHHINFIRRSLRASTGALSQITLSGRAFPPVECSRITHFEMISDIGGSCKDVMDKCLYLSTLLCYPPHVNLVSLIFPHSTCLSITSSNPPFSSFRGSHFQNWLYSGTDTIHLYCHISKIHLYYFFTFRIFFILTQPNLRFKNIFD